MARRYFPFAALAQPRRGNMLIAAGAAFALGLAAGAFVHPSLTPHASASEPVLAAAYDSETDAAEPPLAKRLDRALAYPAEVIRVIDGDTFEARVRVWPGLDVDTKVRLRGIDAAELHARCADELAQAQAARAALQTILAQGGVAISQVGIDTYGGRVDAQYRRRFGGAAQWRLCAQL